MQNTLELRKSVGQIENLSQPQYNLAGWDATYSTDIYNNATDYIRQYALSETDEPSFTTMNKWV